LWVLLALEPLHPRERARRQGTRPVAYASSLALSGPYFRALLPFLLRGRRLDGPGQPLFLEVANGRLDRVLGKDRAMDLHRRQLQLVDDVRVLDLERVVHALALEPLGGQARAGDGGAAAEGLELGILDETSVEVDLDLQLHDVATLGSADEARAQPRRVLGEGPDVAGVVVMIDHLFAVGHARRLLTPPSTGWTSGP